MQIKSKNFILSLMVFLLISSDILVGDQMSVSTEVEKVSSVETGNIFADRASSVEIKAQLEEVMARSEFASINPQKVSWMVKADKFLSSIFDIGDSNGMSAFATFLFWFLMIWCLITLVAIIIHFIWSIFSVTSFGFRGNTDLDKPVDKETCFDLSIQELKARIDTSKEKGDYSGALFYLTMVLLKTMEKNSLISIHPSKTNGDYLRECGRKSGIFVRLREYFSNFELVAYGFRTCDADYFQKMQNIFDTIHIEREGVGH